MEYFRRNKPKMFYGLVGLNIYVQVNWNLLKTKAEYITLQIETTEAVSYTHLDVYKRQHSYL